MALWFRLKVNTDTIGVVEVRRLEHLDLTDPHAADQESTYQVTVGDTPVGQVRHRYGDGAWRLLASAADLIVEAGQ